MEKEQQAHSDQPNVEGQVDEQSKKMQSTAEFGKLDPQKDKVEVLNLENQEDQPVDSPPS